MKRKFYRVLENWRHQNNAKPLMVIGVRQVGKTYLLTQYCREYFNDYVYFNLMKQERVRDIFESKMSFEDKIKELSLESQHQAIISLKYFDEMLPKYRVLCAGSLLGVKLRNFNKSFPVGKVDIYQMYPLDFEEFLWALDHSMWSEEIHRCFVANQKCVVHDKLMRLYHEYLLVGGMPEAVNDFIAADKDIMAFNNHFSQSLIQQYLSDMNKFVTSKAESVWIESVYQAIPSMLASELKRFQYRQVKAGAGKRELYSAVDWLASSNLIYQCFLVNNVKRPLKFFRQNNIFKLYLSDTGLLSTLVEVPIQDIMLDRDFLAKGALAENYVAQHLVANGVPLHYWKSNNTAEIDFLLTWGDEIVPVEVKASSNKQSKSLRVYREKYQPRYSIRVSARNFGLENGVKAVPLYAAFMLKNHDAFPGE